MHRKLGIQENKTRRSIQIGMKITHNDGLGGMSWWEKQCRLSGEADPMVRESLSREVTFELFLLDLNVKKTQAMLGLRTRASQAEGTVPCKGPMVESNLECSRNRTLLQPQGMGSGSSER